MKKLVLCTAVAPWLVVAATTQAADIGTAFTYQGSLENGSGPVTDTCDFRLGLWDTAVGGNQVGTSPQTMNGVVVSNGVFTVQSLDFGDGAFNGTRRWLQIEVKCFPDSGFTVLAPRVELTPAPHAMAVRGLRTQEGDESPNLVMGHPGNTIEPGVVGANIGGGGGPFTGTDGRCAGNASILCQSDLDCANAQAGPCMADASVGRCDDDQALCSAEVECSTGQCVLPVSPNLATADFATVGGGYGNRAGGQPAAGGNADFLRAPGLGSGSTIGGGVYNQAEGDYSTVSGGIANRSTFFGLAAAIGGGGRNRAEGPASTIGGGEDNHAERAYSTVPGGKRNNADGDFSFAAGRRAKVRDIAAAGEDLNSCNLPLTCGDEGTFVWADSTNADFTSTGPDQFLIRAGGGVGIDASASPSDIKPLASLHLRHLNLSLAADDLENDDVIIESNDAVLGLYSKDDATWGSAIAFKDLELDGTLNDTWGIVRQSSGIGDSSLRFTYGTSDNYATNLAYLTINNAGFVGIFDTTPDAKLDVVANSATVARLERIDDGTIVEIVESGVVEGTISILGPTVSYNAFTGSHYGWTEERIERGTLVTLTGDNRRRMEDPGAEPIYGITPTNKANDPKCLGAYLGLLEPSKAAAMENPQQVMAVGNGDMWVVDTGRNIVPGQYLISSDVKGHAMLDDETRFPVGYVIARAAEAVDWSKVNDSADGHKHARISVFFESFERGSAVAVGRAVAAQQEEIDGLRLRLAAMEQALSADAQASQSGSLASIGAFAIPALALLGFAGLIVRGRTKNGGGR